MKRTIFNTRALLTALFANAQQKWTLQQCVDTALANNRNINTVGAEKQRNCIQSGTTQPCCLTQRISASHGLSWGRALDEHRL